jgi:hypothetical protein
MTEDRRNLSEPPETTADRLLSRLWDGYGQLLHKLFGRYYDPVDRNGMLLVLFFAVMALAGAVVGTDGSLQLLGFAAGFSVLWGVLVYRREQRWRA